MKPGELSPRRKWTVDNDYGVIERDLSETVRGELEASSVAWFDVTGSVPVFYNAQTALLDSLKRSLFLAFAVIALTMAVLLRGMTAGILSVLPGAMPIAMVFGTLSWSGHPLDIGTMLTGSVALGIAVDDMLHLVTWFRSGVRQGKSRENAVREALEHCGPAMTQTTLVIGLSLLLLFPSDLLLIRRFGWVMAMLLGIAWLAEVVLLPALLIGPLGFLIQSTRRGGTVREREAPSTATTRPIDIVDIDAVRRDCAGPSTDELFTHPRN